MRGALMILFVIAMLVVGILVIKNMQINSSDSIDGEREIKIIERAEEAADAADQKIGKIKQRLQESE
jgi:flagellar biogenesis protein FliO